MPHAGRRCDRPPDSLEDTHDVSLERLAGLARRHTGRQFLRHDDAEVLERRERTVEALKKLVGSLVAKGVDEQLRVEHVLAQAHSFDHSLTEPWPWSTGPCWALTRLMIDVRRASSGRTTINSSA